MKETTVSVYLIVCVSSPVHGLPSLNGFQTSINFFRNPLPFEPSEFRLLPHTLDGVEPYTLRSHFMGARMRLHLRDLFLAST